MESLLALDLPIDLPEINLNTKFYYTQFGTFKPMTKNKTINVKGTVITIIKEGELDFISLTDMLKAKDGDFFISDW